MSNLYNVLDQGMRNDAPSVFFERELERIKAQTYDVLRAPMGLFDWCPIDQTASPADETIVYRQYDQVGMAKIIADYSQDLPRVDVTGKEFVARIKSIGGSYGYSVQEIRAAQQAGKSLDQRKANALVRAHRERMNQIGFYGDDSHGLQGWLENSNIPVTTADNTFENLSNTEVVELMTQAVTDVEVETNGIHRPDTLLMDIDRYAYVANTRMDSGTDTTILQFFQMNNPDVSVGRLPELRPENRREYWSESDDPFGTNSIMIAYVRSPDTFWCEIPLMFEQFPVQEKGLEFVIPAHSRMGGVMMPYPLSQNIVEGI